MRLKHLLAACLAVACSRSSKPTPVERAQAPADAPNILLVSIDTLRADALPAYGYDRDTAPALTALAEQGVVFERSWSQAPSTSPTHASMFTGQFVHEHKVMGTYDRLPKRFTTLAEHFWAHGFHTWATASSVRFARGVQLDQGFEDYDAFVKGNQKLKTDSAMEVALKAIQQPADQPWLGFVHLMDVHAPYMVPEPHQSRFLQGRESSVPPERTVKFVHKYRSDPDAVSILQRTDLRAMYDGGVSFVDTRIATLWEAVQRTERPTVLIITADHGEAFFENGYLGHATFVWEDIVRVPLIMWAPDRLPAGARRTTLAQSVDLFPTLASFAGIPTPPDVRGIDLSGVARGDGEVNGRKVVVQSRNRWALIEDDGPRVFKLRAKVKKKRVMKAWLHELTGDPGELVDLSDAWPERTSTMTAVLNTHRFAAQDAPQESWELSDEERSALEAIGYME